MSRRRFRPRLALCAGLVALMAVAGPAVEAMAAGDSWDRVGDLVGGPFDYANLQEGTAITASSSGVLFVAASDASGTGDVAIWRSTDAGSTWNRVGTGTAGGLAIDGQEWPNDILWTANGTLVVVGGQIAPGFADAVPFVATSGDEGATWTQPDGDEFDIGGDSELTAVVNHSVEVLVAVGSTGPGTTLAERDPLVYTSFSEGAAWARQDNAQGGGFDGVGVQVMNDVTVAAGASPLLVAVGAEQLPTVPGSNPAVWTSVDGGSLWVRQPGGPASPFFTSGNQYLAGVTARENLVISVGADDSGVGGQDAAVWTSGDLGVTWLRRDAGGAFASPAATHAYEVTLEPDGLAVAVGDTFDATSGSYDGAVWTSADNGQTWTPQQPGALGPFAGDGDQRINSITTTPNGRLAAAGSDALPAGAGERDVAVWVDIPGVPPTPVVSGVTPASGPEAGATSVTITGSALGGATAVGFGATPAASFTTVSDTSIIAVSPAGTGTVDVRVTTQGGTSAAAGAADDFTYVAGSPPEPVASPSVSGIDPAFGPSTGGTLVTISGDGFADAAAVFFGASNAASFSVSSDTAIVAVAPPGGGTVPVTVVAGGNTSEANASAQFTYLDPFLCADPPPLSGFGDIEGSFAEAEITCLEAAGLVAGVAPGQYAPDKVVSRAEMAVFLMNAYEGGTRKPYREPGVDVFTDISGSFAETRIRQLVGLGITAGTGPTTYSPDSPVTRGQMAVFLVRLYERLGGPPILTGPVPFTDISGHFAEAKIAELVALGVTAGTSPATYSPDTPVTRAQMAVFIVRLLEGVT